MSSFDLLHTNKSTWPEQDSNARPYLREWTREKPGLTGNLFGSLSGRE